MLTQENVASNRRILIVDDNPEIHGDFKKILATEPETATALQEHEALLFGPSTLPPNRPKFTIDSAQQGQEGLALVRKAVQTGKPYALAFVDARMPPGWDGIETTERIWQICSDLQVVICTAYSDYSWDKIVERLGQIDSLLILRKPFDAAEVRQLACALTEKWHLNQLAQCRVADLETMVEKRTAELEGRRIDLENEIWQRKRVSEELLEHAFHDSLTNLPNRALFVDRLERAFTRAKRPGGPSFAVLFVDLDRFKLVNDRFGHTRADQLLITVAQMMLPCVRAKDTIARVGGDEFAILLDGLTDPGEAERVAQRIQQALAQPVQLDGQEIFATASIGITSGSSRYTAAEDLLRDADTAMYRAKARGKGQYEIFDRHMRELALAEFQLRMDLQRALERQQFSVYYQPIVAVQTGEITGCEALVRWNHPTRGLIAPGEFIANMEDTGLIVPIGKWILRTACAQNKAWQQAGFPAIYVSVNVSLVQFHRQNFTRIVSQTLEETGLDPRWLRLELTESVLMEDAELTSRTLNELGKMGIRIAIDDFGTGYSSMSYLHCLPLQSLKIDRSFLHAIKGDDCPAAEIMTTMTRSGYALHSRLPHILWLAGPPAA